MLRLSLDAKARVNIGLFDRGGKNRITVETNDHDFNPKTTLTPYGIFIPEFDELFLYFTASTVTSDFIVDILEDFWESEKSRFEKIKTLIINQDNRPENNSRRTQFMKRIVEFYKKYQVDIRLAYYPPYHSKYNPIERTWAVLENHWNGSILDEIETALKFAQTMTWKGKHPIVKLITETYEKGVKLTKKASDIAPKFLRIADNTVTDLENLITGANETGFHVVGANWGQDFILPELIVDLRKARVGDRAIHDPNQTLQSARGIEVGHIFQLGYKYSQAMNAFYTNEAGESTPICMGCYGIGVSRLAQAAVEQSYDKDGIIWHWPRSSKRSNWLALFI